MDPRAPVALALSALVLAGTPAAAATAMTAHGVGQASFTICINLNAYVVDMAGQAGRGGMAWTVAVALRQLHPACGPPVPLLEFEGPWDPAAGGCGLRSTEWQLCLSPSPPGGGIVDWQMCRRDTAVCDELERVLFGRVLLAAA